MFLNQSHVCATTFQAGKWFHSVLQRYQSSCQMISSMESVKAKAWHVHVHYAIVYGPFCIYMYHIQINAVVGILKISC